MTQTNQLLLIDLSAISHMVWHVSGNEPDPSFVSTQIIARVRALSTEHPHAAVCCDHGKSFRADIDPGYKAQRDTENRAPLRHQMDVACETLKRDGFHVWAVRGFEADDVIATATTEALKIDGTTVLIASSDKDLLQLVSDRVSAKSLNDGGIKTPADVFDKFGVKPEQMGDLLCLMGDASDNIKGADKIGKVIGARLLAEHGTLEALYAKMEQGVVAGVTPGIRSSLMEFRARTRGPHGEAGVVLSGELLPEGWTRTGLEMVRQLIALRTDAPIPFHEIAVKRTAPPMEEAEMEQEHERFNEVMHAASAPRPEPVPFEKGNDANDAPLPFKAPEPTKAAPTTDPRPAQRIEPKPTDIAYPGTPAPPVGPLVDFSQQLEPRTMPEAITLAKHAFASRLFSAYGTPESVLMVMMAGRELGLSAMGSLRGFHMVDGKPTLSADLIRALVIRSGQAKYFRPTERTATRATWETQRGDDPPVSLSFSIEEAQQAGVIKKGSGWEKFPADMLTARASAKLARLVYSDIVYNLYDPSEL